jgi:hypothetical protein
MTPITRRLVTFSEEPDEQGNVLTYEKFIGVGWSPLPVMLDFNPQRSIGNAILRMEDDGIDALLYIGTEMIDYDQWTVRYDARVSDGGETIRFMTVGIVEVLAVSEAVTDVVAVLD